ncbi:biotin/lipoyl-binding carrier protein [Pseudokineococcus basanitobsidens]|uniref:biotin/lipoyl-binding carrier protein n=1 Tax=Pseudokineococcus basanitobsidens TaxID=1926649 RepID=UPI003BB648EF
MGAVESVRAEMVAGVLSLAVEVGEVVEAGQTLLLLESMKMEIPVVPEGRGRVSRVVVSPGDVVQEGDLLVVLDGA